MKYVAQPLKRRPTLRILFLAAIGVAVYLKYDTVVTSQAFLSFREKPKKILDALFDRGPAPLDAASPVAGWRWSADSINLEADCSSPKADSCLEKWRGLGKETVGVLKSNLGKASAQWDVDAGSGFSARFRRVPDESDPLALGQNGTLLELDRLELRGSKGTVLLERHQGKNLLCAKDRCLDEIHPRTPFANFRQAMFTQQLGAPETRIPQVSFIPLGGAAAGPVLEGRVLEVPTAVDASDDMIAVDSVAAAKAAGADAAGAESMPSGPASTATGAGKSRASEGQWMKIYHGKDIFSYYRGFASLHAGLRPGSKVKLNDTLGLVPGNGDSLGVLEVRIERHGLMIDPYAFLGLQPDSSGPIDGR